MSERPKHNPEMEKGQRVSDPAARWSMDLRRTLERIEDPEKRAEEVEAVEAWSTILADQIKRTVKGGSLFSKDVLHYQPGKYVLDGEQFGTMYETPLGEHGRTRWDVAIPFASPEGYEASKKERSQNYDYYVTERTIDKLAEMLNGELEEERKLTENAIFEHASRLAEKLGPGKFLTYNNLTEAQIVMPIAEPNGEARPHMIWQTLEIDSAGKSGVSRLFDISGYRITTITQHYPRAYEESRLQAKGHDNLFSLRFEFKPDGACIDERPAYYHFQVQDGRGVQYGVPEDAADVYPVVQRYAAMNMQNPEFLGRNERVTQIDRSHLRPPEQQPALNRLVQHVLAY